MPGSTPDSGWGKLLDRLVAKARGGLTSAEPRPRTQVLPAVRAARAPTLPEPAPPATELDASELQAIGDLRLIGEVARGGAGVVYRAWDTRLKRQLALKVLRPRALASPDHLERFLREARILASLDHPAIVRFHGFGQHQGRPYLVMQWVEGESLQERLERAGPLSPWAAAALVRELAEALQHVHARGVVHRDLKPSNVLLTADEQPRIIDFGLAVLPQAAARPDRLTDPGRVLGTPGFWPPEQVRGDLARIGAASDVYALGATLYALLTARPPFQAASWAQLIQLTLETDPTPPSSLSPVDPALESICLRCLAKAPHARYASAQDLAAALADYLAGEAGGLGTREAGGAGGLARRKRGLLAAGGVLLLLGLAAWGVRGPDVPPLPAKPPPPTSVAETPTGGGSPAAPEARGWVERGLEHARRDEGLDAARAFREALRLDPACGEAYARRAELRLLTGDLAGVLADCERALACAGSSPPALHALRAFVHQARDELRAALEACDEALLHDSTYAPALALRGYSQFRLGHPADARVDLDAALRHDPRAALARTWRSLVRERGADALDDLGRALELDPELSLALTYRQLLLGEQARRGETRGTRQAAALQLRRDASRARELANAGHSLERKLLEWLERS